MPLSDRTTYLRAVRFEPQRVEDPSIYPFALPAFRGLSELSFHPRCTFLVGENGSGKSTLLEAIAVLVGLNAEGGSLNFHFETKRSHSDLHEALRLIRSPSRPKDAWFLRAESFFNVATEVERLNHDGKLLDHYGGRSLHAQSHGESFLSLFKHRFFGDGLYLVDEPEAALSPARQLSFLCLIEDLLQRNSQLVIATHSPLIMAYPDALILHFSEQGIEPVAYEDTEHFALTRSFLANPAAMLERLAPKGVARGARRPGGRSDRPR